MDEKGEIIRPAVIDLEAKRLVPITEARFSEDGATDLAFLPKALRRSKPEFLPLIEPDVPTPGEVISCYGYFSSSGGFPVEGGVFSGAIVNAQDGDRGSERWTLPFPIIEGMSGAPLYGYHNGTKVFGVAYGSVSQRVTAYEITDVESGEQHYRETTMRVVEFGLAHHARTLRSFLHEVEASGHIVSTETVEIPGIEH